MRYARSIALGAVLLAASGIASQAPATDERPLPERLDRALRDMMEDVQPTLEGALDYLRSFGAIHDPRHYEMPEVLPNGDVIIRRRDDAPPFRPEPPAAPEAPADDPPADPEEGVRI